MSYITLYRKYRPHNFDDVVGQKIVVKILKNSIKDNKIGHAYIFSGPRGTGKTSIAKIFAKAVNCKNFKDDLCEKCDSCKLNLEESIDIIEIDAASNNGINEIREIKNNIKTLPTMLKYKVYIIDEVHMLSNSAFNALLKTLEEPPSHAIFILATTEINQIPKTVLSRCQKFDFKKISVEDIINRLKYILEKENYHISDDVLNLIANLSDGGLRDAINLLDQIISLNKEEITQTDVMNLIGIIDDNELFNLMDSITKVNVKSIIDYINNIENSGINYINLIDSLEKTVKDLLIFNNVDNYFSKEYEENLIRFSKIDIKKFIVMSDELFKLNNELKKSNNQKMIVEIYLIRIALIFKENNYELTHETNKLDVKTEKNANLISIDKELLINNALSGANKNLKNEFLLKYEEVKEYITNKDFNSIANLLNKGNPEVVSNKNVIFTFKNSFEVLLFDQNFDEIIKFLKKIYSIKYDVVAITNDEWKKVKEEYIKNIKSGKKYEYIEKNIEKSKKNKNIFKENVENIFGEDIIKED